METFYMKFRTMSLFSETIRFGNALGSKGEHSVNETYSKNLRYSPSPSRSSSEAGTNRREAEFMQ